MFSFHNSGQSNALDLMWSSNCMAETLGLRYLITDVFCLIFVFCHCILEFAEIYNHVPGIQVALQQVELFFLQ